MKHKIITFLGQEWPLLLIILAPLLVSFFFYPVMPDRVPSHWNFQGEIDGYMPRFSGSFFLPLMNIGLYLLFLILPIVDPKRQNYSQFSGAYKLIRYIIHVFFAYVYALTLAAALGYDTQVSRLIPLGMAILFIALGYSMRKIKHNYFVGFKLPWTLANEDVWDKTHRLGSTAMMVGGVFYLIGTFIPIVAESIYLIITSLFAPIVVTIIYSYWVFRQQPK